MTFQVPSNALIPYKVTEAELLNGQVKDLRGQVAFSTFEKRCSFGYHWEGDVSH